jgi:hypothetical protein
MIRWCFLVLSFGLVGCGSKSAELPTATAAAVEPAVPKADVQSEAWGQAKEMVLDHLKAPKTAEFTDKGTVKETPGIGGSRWFWFESSVDCKNPYGVPIRIKWTAQLQRDGAGAWHRELLYLDGEPAFLSDRSKKLLNAINEGMKSPWVVTQRRSGFGTKVFGIDVRRAPWRLTIACESGGAAVTVQQTGTPRLDLKQEAADVPIQKELEHTGHFSFVVKSPNDGSWKLTVEEDEHGKESPPPEPAPVVPEKPWGGQELPVAATTPLPVEEPAKKQFVPLENWEGKSDRLVGFNVSASEWQVEVRNLSSHAMRFEVLDANGKKIWEHETTPSSRPRSSRRRTNGPAAKETKHTFSNLTGLFRLRVTAHGGSWTASVAELK